MPRQQTKYHIFGRGTILIPPFFSAGLHAGPLAGPAGRRTVIIGAEHLIPPAASDRSDRMLRHIFPVIILIIGARPPAVIITFWG